MRFELAPKTMVLILVTLGSLWLVGELWAVVLVIVCASILAGTVAPLVSWLEAHRVRRPFAIAIVFGAMTLLLVLWGLATIPTLIDQIADMVRNAPQTQARLADRFAHSHLLAPWADSIRNFRLGRVATQATPSAFAFSLGIAEGIGYFGTTLVLAIYLIADHERINGFVFALFPKRYHVRLARVMSKLGTIVGGYVRGQVITSLCMFVFAFVLLMACGVDHALAIAAFAGVTDVIPFVGGLLAMTPALLTAIPRGEVILIIIFVSMLVYQEFESRILVPRVYGRTLRLPSAAVILALLIGGKLGGILGALLALPIAAAIRMLVEELRVELPGDDSDHREVLARDLAAERVYALKSAGASPEEAAKLATELADEEARVEDALVVDVEHDRKVPPKPVH